MTWHRLILAFFAGAALTLGAAGCDKLQNRSPQEHVQRAKDLQAKGDMRASIIELKNALQKNSGHAEARLLLGQLYLAVDEGTAAEKELDAAAKLGVGAEILKVAVAQALILQGRYAEVLDKIQPGPQSSQANRARILTLRGDALLGLRRIPDGCFSYQEAFGIDQESAVTHLGMAKCAISRRQYDAAQLALTQAIKLDPKSPEAFILKGDLAQMLSDPKAAATSYREAVKLNPGHINANLRLAAADIVEGNYAAARKAIALVQQQAPSHLHGQYLKALLFFREGDNAKARDALQVLLKVAPDNMPAVALAGAVAYTLKTYGQAEKYFAKFLEQYPGSTYVRRLMVETLLQTQQPQRALEYLKPILAKPTEASIYALAGEAYMQLRDFSQATAYFEKAAALAPENAAIRTELGASRLGAGQADHALADLGGAIGLDPGQRKADALVALIHLQRGEFDKALNALTEWRKKDPQNPVVENFSGMAYLGKGDIPSARTHFEKALSLKPTFISAALNLAQLDMTDKNPDAARKRLEGVLESDKSNVRAMLALARVAKLNGQEAEYLSWLQKALKTNPAYLEPRRLLVEHQLSKGQTLQALTMAREGLVSNDAAALDLLGTAQMAAGQKHNALVSYKQLVELAPNSALVHYRLANVKQALGDLPGARKSLERAIELRPDYTDALVASLALEMRSERYAQARAIAQRIRQKSPKNPLGATLEGDAAVAQRDYVAAVKAYEDAFKLHPDSVSAIKIHQALTLAGKSSDAETRFREWLHKNPSDQSARGYLAVSYARLGKLKEAIAQYQELIKLAPNNVLALNDLAWLYFQVGDSQALATAEQAHKLAADNPVLLDTLGWILVEKGQSKRGVELLEKAVAKSEGAPSIRYRYAAALAKTGQKAQARKELDSLLSANKAFPERAQASALLKSL